MSQQGIREVSPSEAWSALSSDPDALMIDVRTSQEWSSIGVPDLSSIGAGRIAFIEWQSLPTMMVDPNFTEKACAAAAESGANKLYFICRSGVRSLHAGFAVATQTGPKAGYECINVAEGFEGNPNATGQRGQTNGWQACGLPWTVARE